jgi:hypothetical protein
MCNSCPKKSKESKNTIKKNQQKEDKKDDSQRTFYLDHIKTSLYINKPLRYLFYVNTENNYYNNKIFIPYINVKSEKNNFVMFVTLAVYDRISIKRLFKDVLRINFPVGENKVNQYFNEFSNGNYNHQIPDTVLFLNQVKKRLTEIAVKESKSTVKNILIQQSTRRFAFSNEQNGTKGDCTSGCACEALDGCPTCFGNSCE